MFLQIVLSLFGGLQLLQPVAAHAVPLPPSVDPFYQPPPGFESRKPGEILRSRAIDIPSSVTGASRGHQLLYRSIDSHRNSDAVVTTIFAPSNEPCTEVLSLQTAYNSPATDCAPSYTLRSGTASLPEQDVIPMALKYGWCVSIPDFEGPRGAYTNGLQSGYATLDSIRALSRSGNVTGISSSAKFALAGGSGGAIGSEWALELMHEHAPEIEERLVGALLTALVPNVTSTFLSVDGTISSSLIPLSLLGLSKQSSSFADWLAGATTPNQTSSFFAATTSCADKFGTSFSFRSSKSFLRRTNAVLESVPQSTIEKVGLMGRHGRPSIPILVYKGTQDRVSPVVDTDRLVTEYRSCGVQIEYRKATNAGHSLAGSYGFVVGLPCRVDV
ncbi:hypothetical protein PRZ48_006847 [Zasmidium cellare]|uniref:Uncharacterized protein n=1 Tax=Zasmidium cellare TaxID=395010 RepID=A0ABR0EIG9_ZASCE|nr:hypothetical protein PRZ48_006847 [Zasmidium cellare]